MIPILLAVLATIGTWWLCLNIRTDQATILRYSFYVGITQLGTPADLRLLPELATACLLGNVIMAYLAARRSLVLRLLWLWSGFVVSFGWLWAAILLHRLNV